MEGPIFDFHDYGGPNSAEKLRMRKPPSVKKQMLCQLWRMAIFRSHRYSFEHQLTLVMNAVFLGMKN